jgi:nucleosome binding factor SPN SPT16 subunit
MRVAYLKALKLQQEAKEVYVDEKFEPLRDQMVPRLGGGKMQVRPALSGKKNQGSIEAHRNGFRYRSTSGDTLQVMYKNIRLAVMQPSTNEVNTYIHLVLKQPMKVANRPTTFITFFKQVVESSIDLSIRSSGMTDQAELAEEERERRWRKKTNKEFREFQKAIDALNLPDTPKFERPQRQLGFYGSPGRGRVFIMPTLSALVAISEQPFVLMRSDIEVAAIERAHLGTSSFDLTFILNDWDVGDYSTHVVTIQMIDADFESIVKQWLEATEIRFYRYEMTGDWRTVIPILKKKGRELFETEGGWDAFFAQDEAADESSESFDPEEDEAGDDDDEDEAFDPDDDEDDDDDDDDGGGEEDDDGLDWRQLEEQARESDKRKEKKWADEDGGKRSGDRDKGRGDKGHHHHHSDKKDKGKEHHHSHHHHSDKKDSHKRR